MVVGGIILLIIGIVAFSYLGGLKSEAEQALAQCQSLLGQAGQFLSPDVSRKCQLAQQYTPAIEAGYYIGIAFAFVGVAVAISGAFRRGNGKTGTGKRGEVERI